jgi:hypothetical protein
MLTIPQALRRIKGNVTQAVPPTLIHRLCRQLDLTSRQRTLPPVVTTSLFLQQVLHGNTAVGDLRHRCGLDFTDSAYCQARGRLPVAFFRRLQRAVTGQCRDAEGDDPAAQWHGHRTFLMDGSSFSMPDTAELQEFFGQPGMQAAGCGFPTAHLLALWDAHTGYLVRAIPAPLRTHDLAHAALLPSAMQPGDVLVGDRALCSYAHLALCRQRRLHGLFRAHQRLLIDFRPHRPYTHPRRARHQPAGRPRSRWLKRLGKHDQLVEYFKPAERPAWLSADDYARLPESVVVRELRVRIRQPGRRVREVTLVTTLLDPQRYSARALAKLYERRWAAETNLKYLKETLGMDVLRCGTVPGVIKELLVYVSIYNLVRRVMLEAGRRQGVAPQRISFVDALRWLRHARPGDALPRLRVNPERPGRAEPRARKRRPKKYKLLNRPRAVLRAQLLQGSVPKEHAA